MQSMIKEFETKFISLIPSIKLLLVDLSEISPSFLLGGGELDLLPNFQTGGLNRTSTLRGGCWKRGITFFMGSCNFYKKTKLKSEIFNGKKSL